MILNPIEPDSTRFFFVFPLKWFDILALNRLKYNKIKIKKYIIINLSLRLMRVCL